MTTPLATRILKEKTLPLKDRTFNDKGGLLDKMDDIHCFDCSAIYDMAWEMAVDMTEKNGLIENPLDAWPRLAELIQFLPAKKTWVEWRNGPQSDHQKVGVLLQDNENGTADVILAQSDPVFGAAEYGVLPLVVEAMDSDKKGNGIRVLQMQHSDGALDSGFFSVLTGIFLAMINTPRIIGRRQHMPHAGLQRKLARASGMVGKFPLNAWTEIVLEVTPPKVDESEHTGMLSGRRALHWVRSHARIRRGKLEIVRDHWRGDPALGIKRSRYKMVPPKRPAPQNQPNT